VRGDPALIKALARGFRWRRMLEEGRYPSISEMAKAGGVECGYVGALLRLTLLPPPMVEAIEAGRQREGVTLPGLLEEVPAACPGGYFTLTRDRPQLIAGRLCIGADAPDPGPNLGSFFNFRQARSACANPVQTVR
jgi:hypothetical protein